MNKGFLSGTIDRLEVKQTAKGQPMLTFSIIHVNNRGNKNYYRFTMFGHNVAATSEQFNDGMEVRVEYEIGTYKSNDGHWQMCLNAESVIAEGAALTANKPTVSSNTGIDWDDGN